MEIILVELLLWAGLIFFFWVLKDGLGNVETDLESLGFNAPIPASSPRVCYDLPERVSEVIGSYQGAQIYRYATFAGERYLYDHIVPAAGAIVLEDGQRCMEPGLIYVRCEDRAGQSKLIRR
ncbi:MAG TPA: hypothetical protein DIT28_17100 [Oxalobacteraceae bacterium]|nr:hypothetical protein [Oxalobacteraceae bacterium]